MPTENPKISAYVPKVVYDAFREYQQKRGLSMSQAAIEIFVEYFGLNLEAPLQKFTGGLPGRLIQVEQSLAELKELYLNLVSQVEQIQTTSRPLEDSTINNLIDDAVSLSGSLSEPDSNPLKFGEESEVSSEPTSNLLAESLEEDQPQPDIHGDTLVSESSSEPESNTSLSDSNDKLPSELIDLKNSEGNLQLNLIDSSSDSPSSPPKELSLPATKLGERLSIDRKTLSNHAKKKSADEFAAMTRLSDPDSIAWVYSEQLKRYVPHRDLSTEQIQNLKAWKEFHSTK
jgi:hypothetical protein